MYADRALATINTKNALAPVSGPYGGPSTKLGIAVLDVWHASDHYGQMVEYVPRTGNLHWCLALLSGLSFRLERGPRMTRHERYLRARQRRRVEKCWAGVPQRILDALRHRNAKALETGRFRHGRVYGEQTHQHVARSGRDPEERVAIVQVIVNGVLSRLPLEQFSAPSAPRLPATEAWQIL